MMPVARSSTRPVTMATHFRLFPLWNHGWFTSLFFNLWTQPDKQRGAFLCVQRSPFFSPQSETKHAAYQLYAVRVALERRKRSDRSIHVIVPRSSSPPLLYNHVSQYKRLKSGRCKAFLCFCGWTKKLALSL